MKNHTLSSLEYQSLKVDIFHFYEYKPDSFMWNITFCFDINLSMMNEMNITKNIVIDNAPMDETERISKYYLLRAYCSVKCVA